MKSFEAEVVNKIHNISHVPSPYHQTQYQQHYHNGHHPMYSFNERQRYRSNNDLRMDDNMSYHDFDQFNGLGRRQPSLSELMFLQKVILNISLLFKHFPSLIVFFLFHFLSRLLHKCIHLWVVVSMICPIVIFPLSESMTWKIIKYFCFFFN